MTETSTLTVSDISFSTVMDTAFHGRFSMAPEPHSHPYFELHASISGEYRIEILNGETITMKPPMICLIPTNCCHSTYAVSDGAQKLALRFKYSQTSAKSGMPPFFDDFDHAMRRISEPICIPGELICETMISIRNELTKAAPASELLVSALINQLYILMFRLIAPNEGSHRGFRDSDGSNQRYYRIEIYFAEHFSESITEEDLARELMLSKRQTSRILREVFGMSFRDKLIEARMRKAAKLLEITDFTVNQISEKVGYNSQSGFRVTFKSYFGVSCGEYRKRLKP